MKKIFILVLCVALFGCSYTMKDYIENPTTILRDPLSYEHREDLNKLERAYLRKEMTYAQYLEKKKQLEEDYNRDVQNREDYD